MDIRLVTPNDLPAWVSLRQALWPTLTAEAGLEECQAMLHSDADVAYIAWQDQQPVGFIEGQLRQGDDAQLYGHVEGWYVTADVQGTGVGKALMSALSNWFLHRHIRTLFSDTNPDYPLSPAAHQAAGFEEVDRILIYRKRLNGD